VAEVQDYNGNTALYFATQEQIVAQLLAVDYLQRTPLHEAAEGGHIKVVAQLLARKPDLINKEDDDSYTALTKLWTCFLSPSSRFATICVHVMCVM